MSIYSSDEYVSATPDSTPARPVQSRMFQYFTPENSPGHSRVARLMPVSFPTVSPFHSCFSLLMCFLIAAAVRFTGGQNNRCQPGAAQDRRQLTLGIRTGCEKEAPFPSSPS